MTIKDAVKAAIARMPGNKPFRATAVSMIEHPKGADSLTIADMSTEIKVLSRDQITAAIADLPHVQRDGKGSYRVKGRRTPPR